MAYKWFAIATICCLLFLASSILTPLTAATTIPVDTFDDVIDTNLDCSLREAIIAADSNMPVDGCPAGSGDDLIVLAAGSYTLTATGSGEQATLTGDLDITAAEGLTIEGAGMVSTTIDAGAIDRAFDIINPLSHVTMLEMTIQNGRVSSGQGSGAIKNLGTLTLTKTIIQDSHVEGGSSDDVGGAICNGCGMATGSMTIFASIIRNNSAQRAGGIFSNVPLTIIGSAIVSNSAMAGGGLINYAAPGNGVTIVNSTISGNHAGNNSGGIGQFGGSLVITNSTIADNAAPLGAGINYGNGATFLVNTIVANNTLGANCLSLGSGTITSNGSNLSSDATCNLNSDGDLAETDPLLLPLDNYGGPTPTHKLSFRSPAIDAGLGRQCPLIDQRALSRPAGERCDIGACEFDDTPQLLFLPNVASANVESP